MTAKYQQLGNEKFFSRVVVGRVWVLSFILGSIALFDIGVARKSLISFTPIYVLLLLCFIQIGFSLVFLRGKEPKPVSYYCQLIFDIIVVTLIVYITGASLSPFNFLYLPITMLAALSYSMRIGLITSVLCSATYLTLAFTTSAGILPLLDGRMQDVTPAGGIWFQSGGLTFAMLIVSYLTSTLRGSLIIGNELVERSIRNLEELDLHHRSVFDNIPQPTIILDAGHNITKLNQATRKLFKIALDEKNVSLQQIKAHLPNLGTEILKGSSEFTLDLTVDGEPRSFKAEIRKIQTANRGHEYCVVLFDNTDLASAEQRLAAAERMATLLARGQEEAEQAFWNDGLEIIGESQVIKQVFQIVAKVSATDATVLVTGESGTGKELVARAIHRHSPRANQGLFIPVNCGAIPENLMESQFFGHIKGAFTGADRNVDGFFKQAHRGTLFLDEIAELPLNMQTKLLRAIQERRIRPVGSEKELEVDVRIISATHKNLREQVQLNQFREDLFYRLNVISIPMPPLRDRREDIPLLLEFFLRRICKENQELPLVTPQTLDLLTKYHYPGNIRELQNIIERAIILGGRALLPEHLPETVTDPQTPSNNFEPNTPRSLETIIVEVDNLQIPCNLDEILNGVEKLYLEQALELSSGIKKDAAKLLGINSRSLRYRLQKYGLGDG